MEKEVYYSNVDMFSKENIEELKELLLEQGYTEDEMTEELIERGIYSLDDSLWDYFYSSLKKLFIGNTFVLSGEVGRWNGTVPAGTILTDIEPLIDGLSNMDYVEFFKNDNGEFEILGIHHDGRNRYILRKLTYLGKEYLEENYGIFESNPAQVVEVICNVPMYSETFEFRFD